MSQGAKLGQRDPGGDDTTRWRNPYPRKRPGGCSPGHPGTRVPSILWLCIQLEHFCVPEGAPGSNSGVQERVCLDTWQPLSVPRRLRGLTHLKASSCADPELGSLTARGFCFCSYPTGTSLGGGKSQRGVSRVQGAWGQASALGQTPRLPPLLSQDSPYGLSFVRFHSPPGKDEPEASPQVSSTHHSPEPSPSLFTPPADSPHPLHRSCRTPEGDQAWPVPCEGGG